MQPQYAQILLPLQLPTMYTYSVPESLFSEIRAGQRAVVQFGSKRLYAGLVMQLTSTAPPGNIKQILYLLDKESVVNDFQMQFWQWMASYYLCTPGEVMGAALPSGLRLSSESMVSVNPGYDISGAILTEPELRLLQYIKDKGSITIAETSRIPGIERAIAMVQSLFTRGAVELSEELAERYRPKTSKMITLSQTYHQNEPALNAIMDYLDKRAPKQSELLQVLLNQSISNNPPAMSRSSLLKTTPGTEGALRSLISKGIVDEIEVIVSRIPEATEKSHPDAIVLTQAQDQAYSQILQCMAELKPVLLFGITSSGKTEIYIKLIAETIRQGKQVLYLLPEIALTSQIIRRLQNFFGNRVGVYHSRYGEPERVEVWQKVLNQTLASETCSIILGARSAVFLPFSSLGLVIVDEEHDSSFKQHDPQPRYNARDAAVYLAAQHKAAVVLGSATPALESYFNTATGKYRLVELKERYGNVLLPVVETADLKEATRRKTMKSHFTPELIAALEEAIQNNEQAILFQNRRGFSLRIECSGCQWIPHCRHCDVTLIYHKSSNQLRCHYCGYHEPTPEACPECGNTALIMIGFGTERVEEDLALLYPDLRIERLDLDSTRSKHSYQRIIGGFEEHSIDVLTGTQMVTKGLNFEHVSLVGILNADNMIHFPDFRAFERSFQLMAQVSGRAGRKHRRGKVILQTRNPENKVIKWVINTDYEAMYNSQMEERRQFGYPPFTRLVRISLRHKEQQPLEAASVVLARELRRLFPGKILGPEYPLISRIKNLYIKDILIKLPRTAELMESKHKIKDMLDRFAASPVSNRVKIAVDVDPV